MLSAGQLLGPAGAAEQRVQPAARRHQRHQERGLQPGLRAQHHQVLGAAAFDTMIFGLFGLELGRFGCGG